MSRCSRIPQLDYLIYQTPNFIFNRLLTPIYTAKAMADISRELPVSVQAEHREYAEESKCGQERVRVETSAPPLSLNAPRVGRPDVLDHFPFKDDGDIGALLTQPPGPAFLSLGVPLRKRLAAKVYADCSAGRAGMKISDIPKGLELLGLRVDDELAKGFQGTFSSQPLSLGQWQGVVKRFAVKEEYSAAARKRQQQHRQQHQLVSQSMEGNGVAPRITAPTFSAQLLSTIATEYPAPVGGTYDSGGDRYRHLPVGGLPGLGDGACQATAVGIADSFLRGPLGKLVVSRPDGWWGDEAAADTDTAGTAGPIAGLPQDDDSAEVEEKDANIMRSLGLLAKSATRHARGWPGTSAPAPVGSLPEENREPTLSLKEASQHPKKKIGVEANPDKGWRRSKGGLCADFGPPNVFRRRTGVTAPLEGEPSPKASARPVPPYLMAMLRPPVRQAPQVASKSGAKALSLAEHRRNAKARLKMGDDTLAKEGARRLEEASAETQQAFARISRALQVGSSQADNSQNFVRGEVHEFHGPVGADLAVPEGRGVFLNPSGVSFVGAGSEDSIISETDTAADIAGESCEVSQTMFYDAANMSNVSVDSSTASPAQGGAFGTRDDGDDVFVFTSEQTAFLGTGVIP